MAIAFRRATYPRALLLRFEKPLQNQENMAIALLKDKTVWLLPASFIGDNTFVVENSLFTFENIVRISDHMLFLGFSKDGALAPDSIEILVFHNSFFLNYFDLLAAARKPTSTADTRKTVAVFTQVVPSIDPVFLRLWEAYYATWTERTALYVLAARPNAIPPGTLSPDVNVIKGPTSGGDAMGDAMGDVAGDARVAAHAANTFQRFLIRQYQVVLHVRPDELVLHPLGMRVFVEALGKSTTPRIVRPRQAYDLVHDPAAEPPLDLSQPITQQRSRLVPTDQSRRPTVTTLPATWGIGFHGVLEQNATFVEEALAVVHLLEMDQNLSSMRWAHISGVAAQPKKQQAFLAKRLNQPDVITLPEWMKGLF
jgi:hypothetical protein